MKKRLAGLLLLIVLATHGPVFDTAPASTGSLPGPLGGPTQVVQHPTGRQEQIGQDEDPSRVARLPVAE